MILVTGGLGSIGSHTARREDTGFRPAYDVEHAVADYVDWLRGHEC